MSVKTLWALDELNQSVLEGKKIVQIQWVFFRCKRVKWHLYVLGSAFVHTTLGGYCQFTIWVMLFLNLNQTRGHFFTSFSPLTYQNNLFSLKQFFTVPIIRCPIALVGFVLFPMLGFVLFWSLPTHQTSNRIVENKTSQSTKTYTRTQFSKSCYRNENWNGTCCFVLQRMRM